MFLREALWVCLVYVKRCINKVSLSILSLITSTFRGLQYLRLSSSSVHIKLSVLCWLCLSSVVKRSCSVNDAAFFSPVGVTLNLRSDELGGRRCQEPGQGLQERVYRNESGSANSPDVRWFLPRSEVSSVLGTACGRYSPVYVSHCRPNETNWWPAPLS